MAYNLLSDRREFLKMAGASATLMAAGVASAAPLAPIPGQIIHQRRRGRQWDVLVRSLDEEDKVTSIATRKRRFTQLALPGAAIAATRPDIISMRRIVSLLTRFLASKLHSSNVQEVLWMREAECKLTMPPASV